MSVVKLFTNRYCNPLVATIITIIVILCYYCYYYCWVLLIIVIFILVMVGNVCLFTLRAIWGVSSSWALHIGEVLQWQLRLRDFTSVHQQWRASGWQRGFLSHGATPKAIVYDGTCFKHPLNIWMRGGYPHFKTPPNISKSHGNKLDTNFVGEVNLDISRPFVFCRHSIQTRPVLLALKSPRWSRLPDPPNIDLLVDCWFLGQKHNLARHAQRWEPRFTRCSGAPLPITRPSAILEDSTEWLDWDAVIRDWYWCAPFTRQGAAAAEEAFILPVTLRLRRGKSIPWQNVRDLCSQSEEPMAYAALIGSCLRPSADGWELRLQSWRLQSLSCPEILWSWRIVANLLHSEALGKASGIRNAGDFDLLIVDQDLDKDRHIWGKYSVLKWQPRSSKVLQLAVY